MGIVNVTPDSFYEESRITDTQRAIEHGLQMATSGADIVDVGGESTRPGSVGISTSEEMQRVIPVVEGIRKRSNVFISIDTRKPEVAEQAVACGADIINDISGLRYGGGLEGVVKESGSYIVLMHMRGKPADMQTRAVYTDAAEDVSKELEFSIEKALKSGIEKEKIILDPGIGFAKLAEHNLTLLKNLPVLKSMGYPLLVGLSRKAFLGACTGLEPQDRLIPTVAANSITIFQGADIIRVHDVREAIVTAQVADAIKTS
jgi:dihydropteroate synthase